MLISNIFTQYVNIKQIQQYVNIAIQQYANIKHIQQYVNIKQIYSYSTMC